MRKNAILLFLLGTSNLCFGTQQIDDVLYIESQQYKIKEVPLHTRLDSEKLEEKLSSVICTASWRGYQAFWRINDGSLWLSRILINPCGDEAEHVEADVLFPNQEYPIKADWYSGEIGLVVGEREYIQGTAPKDSLGYKVDEFIFQFEDGQLITKGLISKEYLYENPYKKPNKQFKSDLRLKK